MKLKNLIFNIIKKNLSIITIITIIFIIFIILYQYYYSFRKKKNNISIFGSVSKDISNDYELKKDIINLAESLDTIKYNYIIPNSREGIIGFLLNNINKNNIKNIVTTYSTTFHTNNINKNFKIKYFNNPIDFEEYMIRNSNIFIFLPGGIGTLYEISFVLFLIDVSDNNNNKLIFYNKNNYFNFINSIMFKFNQNGYLREDVYKKFLNNSYFINNIDEIKKIIN